MTTAQAPYTLTLRSYWRSSASWRVRIALELKGLSYRYEPVHLVRGGGEQHLPEHTALNPMAQVPHLTVMGTGAEPFYLTQSVAMLELLDHLEPQPRLIPSEPWLRARVMELVEVINSGIQPVQNLSVLQALERAGGDKLSWAAGVIDKGLRALEQLCHADAALGAGPFLLGEAPCAFEAALIPQLYNARRFKVALERYPRLLELEASCARLEAFQRAAPDAQPDAQLT